MSNGFRDLADGIEIAWTRNREPSLNNIDTQSLKGTGHFDLFNGIELATGDLFTISQGCIEYK